MLSALDRLGEVGTRVINASKDDLLESLDDLEPILSAAARRRRQARARPQPAGQLPVPEGGQRDRPGRLRRHLDPRRHQPREPAAAGRDVPDLPIPDIHSRTCRRRQVLDRRRALPRSGRPRPARPARRCWRRRPAQGRSRSSARRASTHQPGLHRSSTRCPTSLDDLGDVLGGVPGACSAARSGSSPSSGAACPRGASMRSFYGGDVMTRGVRIRLVAFLVLSAVGITYVTAAYLGLVDRVLGRGLTVHATLPTSGGLFEGSEVTYRGVKIGKVSAMTATRDGVNLDLALEDDAELPPDSSMYVHNLSAVGEQYLDFEPPDDEGRRTPRTATRSRATRLAAGRRGRPAGRAERLRGLGRPAEPPGGGPRARRRCSTTPAERCRSCSTAAATFVDEASAHTAETVRCSTRADRAPHPEGQSENIRSFANDLATLTEALADSDGDLRTTLDGHPGDGPRGRRAAEGPRADAAGPARRPDQRQPGVSRTSPAWSSCWSPSRA